MPLSVLNFQVWLTWEEWQIYFMTECKSNTIQISLDDTLPEFKQLPAPMIDGADTV